MGRVCYGPSLSWAEFVMGRVVQLPFFRAGHVTCSNHTTLDGGALRHAPLRLLDLESLYSGRSDQSDWLYQVRPRCRFGVTNFGTGSFWPKSAFSGFQP